MTVARVRRYMDAGACSAPPLPLPFRHRHYKILDTFYAAVLNSAAAAPASWEGQAPRAGGLLLRRLPLPLTTDAELSLDRIGAISLAPQILGDDSEPCCALGVTDEPDMWEEGIDLSDLILHEVGRFLGLHHPFASFDICGADRYSGHYWYASPMAYSPPSPSTACSFLYGMVYDRPCGNPSASCAVFERGRLADARLASLYKEVNEGMSGLVAARRARRACWPASRSSGSAGATSCRHAGRSRK